MTSKKLFLFLFMSCMFTLSYAQEDMMEMDKTGGVQYTPNHKSEFGIKLGVPVVSGDFETDFSYGVGINFRRALDYIFSVRVGAYYNALRGEELENGETYTRGTVTFSDFENNTFGVDLELLISLNNMRWTRPAGEKKVDPYVGVGLGYVNMNLTTIATNGNETDDVYDIYGRGSNAPAILGAAGLAFKISDNVNLAVDYQARLPFGGLSDLVDGFDNQGAALTTFRDVIHFAGIGLNFGFGGGEGASAPLYWSNPMDQVITDIRELQERPVLDLTDSDGDGIIDMMDQEPDSPAGALVDTRGVTLDSDGDGVPDYKDKEPYSMPGYSVDQDGVAQVPNPGYMTEAQVNALIDGKLAGFKGGGTLSDWFLPMIHFNLDSYSIRPADYGHMANIAHVMKSNPSVRVVVKGYTDQLGSDIYNQVLSYNRAKSAVEFLANRYGISRDRLILTYGGENMKLVPNATGGSFMNRRVEFTVSDGTEIEMGRPDGPNAGRGTFGASRASGY